MIVNKELYAKQLVNKDGEVRREARIEAKKGVIKAKKRIWQQRCLSISSQIGGTSQ